MTPGRNNVITPALWGEAAACEPVAKPLSRSCQAALDGSNWQAQMPRGLLVGVSLEVAENHGRPELLGQPVDLLVQQVPQVIVLLGK